MILFAHLLEEPVLVAPSVQVAGVVGQGAVLQLRAAPEDGAPSGRQGPLVQVPGVEVHAQRLQVQVLHLSWGVGAVHHHPVDFAKTDLKL